MMVNIKSITRKIPLISGILLGALWGLVYAIFGSLHSMWRMFDEGFQFFVAVIFGIHNETMSPLTGMFFAFIDGALVGLLFGWISSKLLKFLMTVK
jgi:F0F1-type ATP synthase assembly protein I